jgi:Tfp pilus assembly protein PilX
MSPRNRKRVKTPPATCRPRFRAGASVSAHRQAGFALVSVLAILVLILVLVLSISSVVHVETRSSASGNDLLLARQNALLGLDAAIGQLQEYAGKDQAVTFPATTYYPTKDVAKGTGELFDNATFGYRAKAATAARQTYLTPTERTSWDAALKTWWNASRNPRWTGIMDSSLRVDRATTGNATAMAAQRYEFSTAANPTKFGEPKRDQLPVWLVSGNEKFTINQETGAVTDQAGTIVATGTYPTGYLTPDSVLPDPATNSSVVWLVGEGSATTNATSADGLDGRVKVRKQEVISPTGGNGTLAGHYAYWVGDESTKANFAARDKTSTNDSTYPNDLSISSKEYRNRLQVPQRIGWENISGFGNATFAPNDPYLENISTSKEIGLLQATKNDAAKTQQIKDGAKNNFHSLTAFSKSLLTDAALGGLKRDLTPFFEGIGGGFNANDPIINPDKYVANDSRLGTSNAGFPATTTNIPSWENLKSWHDAVDTGGSPSITIDNAAQEAGIYPVLSAYRIFTAFTYDTTGRVQFHIAPVVVLWNPYDATLASTTYTLKWRHNFKIRNFGVATPYPPVPPSAISTDGTTVFVFTSSNNTTVSSNPASVGNGIVTGIYFISNLTGVDWYDQSHNPRKFEVSNPAGWASIPRYRFSPFDNVSVSSGLPSPDNSTATWVPYTFTTSFAPGEAKIFTINGNIEVSSTAIRDGTVSIPLRNGFDPNRPGSFYMHIANGLKNANGSSPVSGDDVRMSIDVEAESNLVSMSLEAVGVSQPLWKSFAAGYTPKNLHIKYRNDVSAATAHNNPRASPWRRMYELNQWTSLNKGSENHTTSVNSTTTSSYSSANYTFNSNSTSAILSASILPMYTGQISPFLTHNQSLAYAAGVNVQKEAPAGSFRAFAVYNLTAPSLDANRNLDLARNLDITASTGNNQDSLSTFSLFKRYAMNAPGGVGVSTPLFWNENQAAGPVGDALNTRSHVLFGWQSTNTVMPSSAPSDPRSMGISLLPLRQARPLNSRILSLGRFQQVNLSRFLWQPTFPLGNSEASPYVDRFRAAGLNSHTVNTANDVPHMIWPSIRATGPQTFPNNAANEFVDLSYLLNENIWDSYFLSSIPQTGALTFDNSVPLDNSRHRFTDGTNLNDSTARSPDLAAAYLENLGALNINSTSVEAWKALLTAFRSLKISGNSGAPLTNPDDTVPFSRTLNPQNGPIRFSDVSNTPSDYGAVLGDASFDRLALGFRFLSDQEISRLSERIVDEVRLRGPFLSLADFVNRRLVSPHDAANTSGAWYLARTANTPTPGATNLQLISFNYDPFPGLTGITGALQRAINLSGINGGMNNPLTANSTADRVFRLDTDRANGISGWPMQVFPDSRHYLDTEHLAGVPVGEVGQLLSHSPGFVSQGDLLAMIGPALTPRGDTFLVRTYGDVVDKTGRVLSRAYIEAVVQRMPEPVSPAGTTGVDKWRYTDKFGRKFKVVNLRWLRPEEI